MFAHGTNLFLTHKDISCLFETANLHLERINQWFISNKLSLNVSKYSFFHEPSKREDIPFLLPNLDINNSEIRSERSECLKFLDVCDKTRVNSQTEYRINTPLLNTIFTTTIYKNKFQLFFFKCHVFVTKGFSTNIYTTYY